MEIESDKPIRVGSFYPPQIKVAKTGKYKELTDETYNTQSVQTVSVHKQYFEGSGNLTKEFDEDMHGLSIYNGHTEIMRFVIDGVSIPVFPKGSWNDVFKDSFRAVSIIASGPWYVMPLQTIGAAASIVVPDPPDTTAPDNVTNLEHGVITQNSIALIWKASTAPDLADYEIWQGGALLTTVSGTTHTVTGLNAQTQYTFTVKAKDQTGNVATGTSINVTTISQPADSTPPNNVTGLTKNNVTQTGATLTWIASDSSDLKDYRVYKDGTLIATVTTLTYGVTGLAAGTNYTLTVKARDNSNNEASGTSVNVTTLAIADTTAPVLTITPAATFADTKQVTMLANEPADIYYTLDESEPNTSSTKYSVALTLNGTTTVKAFAKDAAGNSSAVQTVIYTKEALPDTTAPDPISGLTAGTPTASTIPFTWVLSPSGDVTKQEIARSTDGTNFTVVSAAINPSSTTYEIVGLIANTAYTVRVVAIDGAGNRSTAVTVQVTTAAAQQEGQPIGVNLVNPDTWTQGQIVSGVDGTLSVNASASTTDYIPLEPRQYYTLGGTPGNRAFFKADHAYHANAISLPIYGSNDKKFIRVSVLDVNKPSFTVIKTGRINLYDHIAANVGKALVSADGTLITNASYYTSDFCPVEPNTVYLIHVGVGFKSEYNDAKTFISTNTAAVTEFTTGANTRFVRFSIGSAVAEEAYLIKK